MVVPPIISWIIIHPEWFHFSVADLSTLVLRCCKEAVKQVLSSLVVVVINIIIIIVVVVVVVTADSVWSEKL